MRARIALFAVVVAALGLLAPAGAFAARSRSVVVTTTPSVAGLRFAFGGTVYTTNSGGRMEIPVSGSAELAALLNPYAQSNRITLLGGLRPDGTRYTVDRWYSRRVGGQRTLVAALQSFVPTTFHFENPNGAVFPAGRVERMIVKRSDGLVTTYRGPQLTKPIMLQATRVVRVNGLVSKDLLYRVQAVTVDGNNLVNRAQQAFLPGKSRGVTLKLLFYSARFSAQDRLFKFAVGKSIKLEFPNRHVRQYKFDENGEVYLPALPRGNYRVTIEAGGIGLTSPVALTRNQVVKIKVVSYLDLAVMILAGLAIAMALVLAGRPTLRARLRNALPRWPRTQPKARTSE